MGLVDCLCRIKAQQMLSQSSQICFSTCLCLYTLKGELPVLDKLYQVTDAATERLPQVTANT